jgi:serine/threonine-protein kinase RsbW
MRVETALTHWALRVRASLDHRALAIHFVETVIGHIPAADRTFRDEMITAFGEAFNNVVLHGYGDRTDGMLEVEADLRADELTLRLIDDGLHVDFASVSPPDLASMPEGGLGIFMMQALVDEVSYVAGEVNVLTLRKRARGGKEQR